LTDDQVLVVRERRAVTPDMALQLSRYFGTSTELWKGLQTAFDLKATAEDSGQKIEAEITPRAG
jgi:addiction module HigA family antidote